MSSEDRLKKYQDAGAEFIESAASKAEDFLRELSKLGESTGKQATARAGDLVGGSKRGTDQFFELVRREISSQLSHLGLATKADLEALEKRLTGTGVKKAAPTKKAAPAKKAAPRQKAAAVQKAAAAPVKKAAPAKKAPAKKASPAAG